MSKTLLFAIAVGGVSVVAGYYVAKKVEQNKMVKEAYDTFKKMVEEDSDIETPDNEDAEVKEASTEPDSRIKAFAKKFVDKIKEGLLWVATNQMYLEAVGTIVTLVTSIIGLKKAIKPATPIELTTKQVEDVVRTTFDGYLDTRMVMLDADIKRRGVDEFLDSVVKSDVTIMKNTNTGLSIKCEVMKGEAA